MNDYKPNVFMPDPERDAAYEEKRRAERHAAARCAFCGAGAADRFLLISGVWTYICDQCVATAKVGPVPEPTRHGEAQIPVYCSFGAETNVPMMMTDGSGNICQHCLDVCAEIVAEKRAEAQA